jgi:hypothetical protein
LLLVGLMQRLQRLHGRVLQVEVLQVEVVRVLQVELLQVLAASMHLPFPSLRLPPAVQGWVRGAREGAQGYLLLPVFLSPYLTFPACLP